ICDDIDIVFSSLGLTKPDFKHTSFDIDYMGNKRILDLALKAKVKKFIYISVFNAEKMLDISNIQAHEQFAGELRKSGMEYTVIRPTGYFSDMLQFLNLAKMGIMPILGDGDKRSNPIHAADLATVAVDAAEGDERDIDAGGPDVFTYREVGELAASVTGTKPMVLSIPLWIGEGLLTVSRLINRDIADIFSFALAVSKLDSVAPQLGTHHLADFFKENL
ncbi:MAG: NAD(P)H-binding protein, partial [Chlorobium sp.]|nr:NAD(P)H-binding protein [Chlorobium sp.]